MALMAHLHIKHHVKTVLLMLVMVVMRAKIIMKSTMKTKTVPTKGKIETMMLTTF